MKRVWMKKVKAVSARAASNEALEGQLNPVRPKAKRRVRTSAAMIGLAISMGTSNLLITRQSDRTPAAEPMGTEPIVSTMPTAPVAQGKKKDLIAPKAVTLPMGGASTLSTRLLPTPEVQLKAASASFTATKGNEQKNKALPVVEPTVQKRQTLKPPAKSSQVNAANSAKLDKNAIATADSLLERLKAKEKVAPALVKASRPDIQAEKELETRRVNRLLQKLKNRQQVSTVSPADKAHSQISSSVVTAASQAPQTKELTSNSNQVNRALSVRQKALINSLKQKPNGLRDQLVTWKAQQSNNSIASTTESAKHISADRPVQINNQAINAPFVLGTVKAQQQVTERSPQAGIDNSTALDLQQSQPTTSGAFVIPDVSKSAVNQPDLVTAVSPNYQVKSGDTLTAIAKQHGVPLSELVKANKLTNPNQIQINQRLKLPAAENSKAFVAQVPMATELQTNGREAIAINPAADSQQQNLAIPPQSLTGNRLENVSLSGIGGNISDDETVVPISPSTVAETQSTQSVATKPQSNHYVEGLRADIEKLRQKYSAQRAASQFAPQANETGSVVASLQAPVSGKAANFAGAINSQPRPNSSTNQPINPEFRAAQVPDNLAPPAKKQRSDEASSATPPKPRSSVATAPLGLNASESLNSLRGQQVSPELPPLGAADSYLPQPASASFKGYIWPAKGALTSGYGWRWGRMHKGIDVAAPVGTPIVAAADGVVVKAGWNSGGYGKLVDIQHADGTLTRYAHNNKILVHPGQQVAQGQQISEMGSSGFSTGPHLHFEVHPLGKKAADPIAYLPGN